LYISPVGFGDASPSQDRAAFAISSSRGSRFACCSLAPACSSRQRPRARRALKEGGSIAVRVSAPSRRSHSDGLSLEPQTLGVSGFRSPRVACVQKLSGPQGVEPVSSRHPAPCSVGPREFLQVTLRLSPQPSHAGAQLASGARPNGPVSHAKSVAKPVSTGRMAVAPTGAAADSGTRPESMPLGRIGDRVRSRRSLPSGQACQASRVNSADP